MLEGRDTLEDAPQNEDEEAYRLLVQDATAPAGAQTAPGRTGSDGRTAEAANTGGNNRTASDAQTGKKRAEEEKKADNLFKQAEANLRGPTTVSPEVVQNYRSALDIRKNLYGDDSKKIVSQLSGLESSGKTDEATKYREGIKGIISALDRLAMVTKDAKESVKYREEALSYAQIILPDDSPNNSLAWAVRHTELAENYKTLGNKEQSLKHFNLATDYWRAGPALNSVEHEGDVEFGKGNYPEAIDRYKTAQEDLNRKLYEVCSPFGSIPSNPRQVRLNEKLGDSYFAQGGANPRASNLNLAAEEYGIARQNLEEYSKLFATGRIHILPEHTRILASGITTECKLAQQNGWDKNHLDNAAGLLTQLNALETFASNINDYGKAQHYGKYDPCLTEAFSKIAANLSQPTTKDAFQQANANSAAAIDILERVYLMQTEHGAGINERTKTLQSVADAHRKAGHKLEAEAVEKVKRTIAAQHDLLPNDPHWLATLKEATDFCLKNQATDYAVRLLEDEEKRQSVRGQDTNERADILALLADIYIHRGSEQPGSGWSASLVTANLDDHRMEYKQRGRSTVEKILQIAAHKDNEHKLPLLKTAANLYAANADHRHAIAVLEDIYRRQSERPWAVDQPVDEINAKERMSTLKSLSQQYHLAGDHKQAVDRMEKFMQITNDIYKDSDTKRMQALQEMANGLSTIDEHEYSARIYGQIYDLQASQKMGLKTRLDTLLAQAGQYWQTEHKDKTKECCDKAIALVENAYAKNDPELSATDLGVMAGVISKLGEHEHAATLREKQYAMISADKNVSAPGQKSRVLHLIASEYFQAQDYAKSAKAYENAIEFAAKDSTLSADLDVQPFILGLVADDQTRVSRDNAKEPAEFAKDLVAFANVLKKSADVLESRKMQVAALKNYTVAAQCLNRSITEGLMSDPKGLMELLALNSVQEKYLGTIGVSPPGMPTDSDLRRENGKFAAAVRQLNDQIRNLVDKIPDSQDPALPVLLDKLGVFYFKNNPDDKLSVPLLEHAFSLALSQKIKIENLDTIAGHLVVAQLATSDAKGAIKTCTELLKQASLSASDKIAYSTLHELSAINEDEGKTNPGALVEALKFKEQEIALAEKLNVNTMERAYLKGTKGLIQVKLRQNKEAAKTFLEAVNLDDTGSLIQGDELRAAFITNSTTTKHLPEAAQVLRQSIEILKKSADRTASAKLTVDLAEILVRQGKIDEAETELIAARQLVQNRISQIAPVPTAPTTQLENGRLAQVLNKQGEFYLKQKKFAQAEDSYRSLSKTLPNLTSYGERDRPTRILLRDCWRNIAKACQGQQGELKAAQAQAALERAAEFDDN